MFVCGIIDMCQILLCKIVNFQLCHILILTFVAVISGP